MNRTITICSLSVLLACRSPEAPVVPTSAQKPTGTMTHAERESVDALIKALRGGKLHEVRNVVARVDVNAQSRNGERPLNVAAEIGWLEAVQLLVEAGAVVEPATAYPSPLEAAAGSRTGRESARVVEYLLSKGADVNKRDGRGNTPALCAAEALASANLEALAKAGADLGRRNSQLESVLGLVMRNLSELDARDRARDVLLRAAAAWTPAKKLRQAQHDLENTRGFHGYGVDDAPLRARVHLATRSNPVPADELDSRCRDAARTLGLGSVPLTEIVVLVDGADRGRIRFDARKGWRCDLR